MLDKIISTNIHTAPVRHIIINQPIDQKRYDHLYEQWLNPDHDVWQDFVAEQQIQLEQQDELAPTRGKNEFVGYWFFTQRSDQRGVHVQLIGKHIPYRANTLLIIKSNQTFKIINTKGNMPSMFNCVVHFNQDQEQKIRELLGL